MMTIVTIQSSRAALADWAAGLASGYLAGAFNRAQHDAIDRAA